MTDPNKHIKIAERVSSRLKLKQLRLLVAIAKNASILHAARELNISQPAATKLLKDLEIDFGVQLFERTNRGAIPTNFGEALVRHSKLILAQISHAAQELDDLNEGTGGRVVVGTLLAASALLLPQTVKELHSQRPNVTIAIRDGTNDVLMPALRSGEVDMVLGRLPEFRHRKELVQEALFDEQSRIVCRAGHPLLDLETISFDDLIACDWILPPPETTLRRQIDKEFLDRGYPPPVNAVESISFLSNRNLILNTDMVFVVPIHVVEHEISHGLLKVVPFDLKMISGPVGVSYRRQGGLSPAASAFLAQLRICAKTL
ncbi:MAG: LysR family transcriptional regulator [Fimbriimonadaceae bacterium]|nr:LysR family transcriptional regulator [Alphaproteobacteria bacterium]